MKVALIGATGLMGGDLLKEAAGRGHQVTAISRHPEAAPVIANATPTKCDVMDLEGLTEALRGHDAVIYAYSPRNDYTVNRAGPHRQATQSAIAATKAAGVPRFLAVGGAGTLKTPDGKMVMESPQFPPQYMESAVSTAEVKTLLLAEPELDWTYLCPSLFFDERGRTGVFRLGLDDALFDTEGQSRISIPDYAVAMIDELDTPAHSRMRWTVGY